MSLFDWHYEFLCAKCGRLLGAAIHSTSVYSAVGSQRLCPKCGVECGSNVKGSIKRVKARYVKSSKVKWDKPWTWFHVPEKIVKDEVII